MWIPAFRRNGFPGACGLYPPWVGSLYAPPYRFSSPVSGYLGTPAQVAVVMFAPLAALAGTEYAARRERTLYFAGLMGLVTLACFILNLAVLGRVFNITSTEKALAAWDAFAP